MKREQIDRTLNQAIAAVKSGEKERALQLFLTIIEVDEKNEKDHINLPV